MTIFLLALLALAWADGPERQAASLVVGGGEVRGISATTDGGLVGMVVGGQAVVLDTRTWSTVSAAPCTVAGVTFVEGVSSEVEVWIGCSGGQVRPHALRAGRLVGLADVGEQGVISALDTRLFALHFGRGLAGASRVYAVGRNSGSEQLRVAVVDPADGSVAQTLVLLFDGYGASAIGNDFLYVAHGDAFVSSVNTATGLPMYNLAGGAASFTSVSATGRASALLASRRDDGMVAEYNGFTNVWTPVIAPASGVRAVGTYAPSATEGHALVAYADRVDVWRTTQGGLSGSARARTFPIDAGAASVLATRRGYDFVGTTGGRLLVLTNRPWIDAVTPSADRVRDGDVLTVAFRSDTAGDLEIAVGGGPAGGGLIVARSAASVGDNEILAPVQGWPDGEVELFVRVTDAQGRTGHAAAPISVEVTPRAVVLSADSVRFGDKLLSLTFAPLEQSGIARYVVYLTTEPFEAADWPEGGPDYVGPDDIEAPVEATDDGSGSIVVTFSPLTNDTTYYLAVRAIDDGGLEGPMSDVVQGRPRPTRAAAELAGERGGFDCDGLRSSGVAGFGLLALAATAARRRRRALAIGVGLVGATLVGVAPARAFDDTNDDGIDDRLQELEEPRGDLTKAWANVELRYGVLTLRDENLTAVYGTGGNNVLFFEMGPQLFRVFELDIGVGLVQEDGFAVDDTGVASTQPTRLTILPVAVTPVFRLHLLDEQILVPYAGLGVDWWLWRESVENALGTKDVISGSKFGWHWSVGLNLLLDTFARPRASMLEAQTGINDSWLTVEFRRQVIQGQQGLSFSADAITAGLKLDF
jgi:hypothetical protein